MTEVIRTPTASRHQTGDPDAMLGAASFRSVADMWHHRIESTPEAQAMLYRKDGAWVPLTWREAGDRVERVANGLLSHGLLAEERVCLLSGTCVEWVLADLATLCAGGATTTIYPSSTAEECAYILGDCEGVFVFCDTAEQVAKLEAIRDRLPRVRKIVVFDGQGTADGSVITLRQLEDDGRRWAEAHPDAYDIARHAIGPERLATLIYTSGTTGHPKGVMLTHDAWIYEAEAIDALGILTPADKQFLFLPLAHVFAKVLQVTFIRLGIPTVIDGDIDALVANLGETQPTWMGAVPRIFEKAWSRIVAGAKESGTTRYQAFKWAIDVGHEVSRVRQARREPGPLLRAKAAIADRIAFAKVKARFGGRVRFFISGSAPLPKEIAEFFHACDILILEGYGLTESSAATCVNTPDDYIFGTVGKPLPGTQIRIAEDGEVLIKGRGVMKGYYNQPEATAEALTADGWLKTGDIGALTDSGHLKITDRKKELIITAGGKNIAPAHFQTLLKARCPYVSQVLMHGDRRPFCTALVALDVEAAGRWAREHQVSYTDEADLSRKPEIKALIQADVDAINKELPSYETVKAIAILPEEMTVENGLMTPTLKMKRKLVEARYAELLDAFYVGTTEKL
jgi:long-chain acyl-CoA synthetase